MPTKFFVVDYRELENIRVSEHPSEDEARAACPSEGGASVVTSEEALKAFSSDVLIAVYNRIRRQPAVVMKFHDKATARRRVWTLLEAYDPTLIYSAQASTAPVEAQSKQEGEEMTTTKKAKKTKAPKEKKARVVKVASNGATKSPRGEKTKEIARLLQQKNGCTAAEVLEATGWPSISMPAISKACGLKLRKEKVKGEKTRYYGE